MADLAPATPGAPAPLLALLGAELAAMADDMLRLQAALSAGLVGADVRGPDAEWADAEGADAEGRGGEGPDATGSRLVRPYVVGPDFAGREPGAPHAAGLGGRPRSGRKPSRPAPPAALIVALQDLDRLSQTAAELGALCRALGHDPSPPGGTERALDAMSMRSLAARLSGQGTAPDDRAAPGTVQLFD
ncbi:hypothetical protein [Paracoccus aeridis]|uniref:hypothetical protein n=1 Tax=Paracoccus aeridis TaxID=1966466 RepID=UPI0010A9BCDA|nr:hypothetical protein [Paracoccus aeridis]